MSLLPLPGSMAKRLDKLHRDFLRQANREPNFKFGKMGGSYNRRKGGWPGVKNFKIQKSSLIHKWLWKFIPMLPMAFVRGKLELVTCT